MSIPESVLREIERAIQAAEFPRGMSVHDGKAKVHSSHLRRLLAELAALRDKALQFDLDQAGIARREAEATELIELRAELAALRAERDALLAAVEAAPHAHFCLGDKFRMADGTRVNMCNCWKRHALGE